MNTFSKKLAQLSLVAMLATALNACDKNKGEDATDLDNAKYSAVLCVGSWPNTAYYIANVPSLTSGTISVKGNGAELTGKVYAQDVLQRNGFYYHANAGSGRLGKYHVNNGALVVDKEVPFTWLDWSSYVWIDDATLVIFGTGDNGTATEGRYAVIKVADMTVTTGKLAFDAFPSAKFTSYNTGFAEYRGGKIYLGYQMASQDWTNYPVMDVHPKFNVAVLNYPAMTLVTTLTDTRSTTPGGPIVYAPVSFQDESGDIYFITDPVGGYDYTAPSAIYRIKSGSDQLDATYYFDFSAKTSNGMGAAMWYIGSGKAIVRTRVAGQSIDADHSFSVIDVKTGTFIKKLDLPTDKGERMVQAVVVENGKAYIAVNGVDKDYVWQYDPATDKLTAGAEFIGGVDYILRLEKLK